MFRDVKLKDKPNLHFQPIPDKNIERSITYITGASGSGKSYYTKMYVDEYKKLYPKREVFLISSLSDDSSIDKIKGLHRVKLNEKFLTTEISAKDFKDCCVIFDVTDCLTDKRYRLKVAEVLNSLLETGRHFNCDMIVDLDGGGFGFTNTDEITTTSGGVINSNGNFIHNFQTGANLFTAGGDIITFNPETSLKITSNNQGAILVDYEQATRTLSINDSANLNQGQTR